MRKARNISLEKQTKIPGWGLCNESAITFPLKTSYHRFIGGVIVLCRQNLDAIDTDYLKVFSKFIVTLSVTLGRGLIVLPTEKEKEKIYTTAIIDGLTELDNRFYLNTVIGEEFYKAKRHNYRLSITIFDIDFFKKVNDTYNHLIGYFILKKIAKFIKKFLNKGDIAKKYEGEEILVVLSFTNWRDAQRVVTPRGQKVENKEFQVDGGRNKVM